MELLLPGHGPVLTDPAGVLDYYIAHRKERLDQVRAAVGAGARTPAEVVAIVYADVDKSLWPAAEVSVRAQLEYLRQLPLGTGDGAGVVLDKLPTERACAAARRPG